jgi:hypothetical protein
MCARVKDAVAIAFVGAVTLLPLADSQAQECRQSPRMHALDFWLGRWDVSQGGRLVGTNTIESTLNGCAILEHWRDLQGGEGISLFYFDQSTNLWKQVWITDRALKPGGTKEKIEQLEYTASGRIRFQGIDRTTLTRMQDGKVRQVIESAVDDGKTWRTTFDAVYQPSSSQPGSACSSSPDAVAGAPLTRDAETASSRALNLQRLLRPRRAP